MADEPALTKIDLSALRPPDVPSTDNPRAVQETMPQLQRRSFLQNIQERKHYAGALFKLVSGWLFGLYLILLLCGTKVYGFELPEKLMITIVGSTTATVIGLFLIVAKYLFNTGDGKGGERSRPRQGRSTPAAGRRRRSA